MQFLHHQQGIHLAYRASTVHCLVAHLLNHPRLLEHRLRQQVLKTRLMQQSTQAIVVGHAQTGLKAVKPVHHRLQREAGMKAGRARVAEDVAFRPARGCGNGAEFGGQEGEIAHGYSSPLKARACREANNASSSARWVRRRDFCCSTDSTMVAKRCWRRRGGSGIGKSLIIPILRFCDWLPPLYLHGIAILEL